MPQAAQVLAIAALDLETFEWAVGAGSNWVTISTLRSHLRDIHSYLVQFDPYTPEGWGVVDR